MTARLVAVAIAAFCSVATTPAGASPPKKDATSAPHADFHAVCPFTVAAPAVVAVLDARRWQNMLAASRTVPPPYEAGATNFRHESIVVVALPYTATPITHASLYAKRPERFDAKTGTLTLWYEVQIQQLKPGEAATTVVGEPCLVTWVPARADLLQVIARTNDGRYLGGTRVAEKPKKKELK